MHFWSPILFAPPCKTHHASEAGALSCVWHACSHMSLGGVQCEGFISDSWTLTACKLLVKTGEHSVSHSIKSATRKFECLKYRNLYFSFHWCVDFSYTFHRHKSGQGGQLDLGDSGAKDLTSTFPCRRWHLPASTPTQRGQGEPSKHT